MHHFNICLSINTNNFFHMIALLVLFIAYGLSYWIPYGNRFMKITCELIIFLLCEITICVSIITFLNDFLHSNDVHIMQQVLLYKWCVAAFFYLLILLPFMSTLIHLMLIYHTIRKVNMKLPNPFFHKFFLS